MLEKLAGIERVIDNGWVEFRKIFRMRAKRCEYTNIATVLPF